MACSACSGNKNVTEYQVRWPATGIVRRYATEAEARAAAQHDGGVYEQVRR